MVVKSHGSRARTRSKLKVKKKLHITKYVQKFKIGDKAVITIDPSSHNAMPYHAFKGFTGTVVAKQGDAYLVSIRDMGREKTVIAGPQHLTPWKGG